MSILNKLFQADEAPTASKAKKPSVAKKKLQEKKEAVVEKAPAKAVTKAVHGKHGDVLLRAVVTEKAGLLQTTNSYVFAVRMTANKYQIADAVYLTYGIRPIAVRVIKMPAKLRMRNSMVGTLPAWKKAMVTLPAGKRITIAEGV